MMGKYVNTIPHLAPSISCHRTRIHPYHDVSKTTQYSTCYVESRNCYLISKKLINLLEFEIYSNWKKNYRFQTNFLEILFSVPVFSKPVKRFPITRTGDIITGFKTWKLKPTVFLPILLLSTTGSKPYDLKVQVLEYIYLIFLHWCTFLFGLKADEWTI